MSPFHFCRVAGVCKRGDSVLRAHGPARPCCLPPQLRFDFDPTYFGGKSSAATASAIADSLGRNTRLLFVFRDPAHQACDKLGAGGAKGKAKGKAKAGGGERCWEAIGNLTQSHGTHGDTHSGTHGGTYASGAGSARFRATLGDFRRRLDGVRASGVCEDPWLANLNGFCYAEHVELWAEVGAPMERVFCGAWVLT